MLTLINRLSDRISAKIQSVGHSPKRGGSMFKNILVPTDGSQLSADTAKRATSFAKEAGARVVFFFAKPE